jgi:hypothetical protein
MDIITHSSKEEYLPEEIIALEQAYKQLVTKSQGEEITLEETRIIVAYKRYQQEGNFKIVAEKAVKAARVPKEPKVPRVPKEKKAKALTKKDLQTLLIMRALISAGQTELANLPQDKQDFYNSNIGRV